MKKHFKIVRVDYKYCNYLRQFDNRIAYNAGLKELRPYIGILFEVANMQYFAPLSSPKPKHKLLKNTIDIIKIKSGNYGAINLNNMIPLTNSSYKLFDLNKTYTDEKDIKRQILLKAQVRWLNNNYYLIHNKALLLYNAYKRNFLPQRVKNRCCNFALLEEKCKEYNGNISN